MEFVFYQLTVSPFERVVPKLLEKAYEQGLKAVIVAPEEMLKVLDTTLWTYSSAAFLPHAIATEDEDFNTQQPILLTSSLKNPNGATILVTIQGKLGETLESLPNFPSFQRVLYLYEDQTDLEPAKEKLQRKVVAQNLSFTHWQQGPKGEWLKI